MIVQNKGEYVRHIGVRLIPGTNNLNPIDAEAFKEALNHPLNKYLVEDLGEITFEDGGLSDLSQAKAKEMIKDTFDVSVLEEWQEKETRKSVLNDITKQIESIKNPPDDKLFKEE